MSLLSQIDRTRVPQHIAIIMDGNGRWAQRQGEERLFGHHYGVEAVRETLKAAQEIGVKHLTLYAFSTENWNRPKEEVEGLMNLLVQTIANEVDELNKSDVIVNSIGNIEGMPEFCQKELKIAYEKTKKNKGVQLNLALNYSSKWEIVNAIQKISQEVQSGKLSAENISSETVSQHLSTQNIPDPELMIRTSGEHRISNFLLWQIAYSELHFTDVLWPDFKRENLYKAVVDFQSRERRFGKTSAQLKNA